MGVRSMNNQRFHGVGGTLAALFPVLVLAVLGCHPIDDGLAQDIHLSTGHVDFGWVPAGSTATEIVRVHNAGDYELVFSEVPRVRHESGHDAFTLEATWDLLPGAEPGTTAAKIAPRSYVEMLITFSPEVEEDSFAYVGLYTNDTDEANRVLLLQGSSRAGAPVAQVTPSTVDFGFVADGDDAEETVEIRNVGEVALDVAEVTVVGTSGSFEVLSWPSYPIEPGAIAPVSVGFTSADGDHETASLIVEIADVLSTRHVVTLSANTPGAVVNSPPEVYLLDPTDPAVFYPHLGLQLLAHAADADQPTVGLYCTLVSNRVGILEQETSDPALQEVSLDVDIEGAILGQAPGVHTLTLCCSDVADEATCVNSVVSIDAEFQAGDDDGDGYIPGIGDCDDDDPDIFPGALELADGADNDCDGIVDEDTVDSDDDGDGLSEAEGDCDDSDADIGPGAAEQADLIDNDCDGDIDEGTDYFDDDLDGFSEALGDCDDDDPDVYSGAVEWCDGRDNDCDGEADEACVDVMTPLGVIGGVQADVVVAAPQDGVGLCLTVAAAEDAELHFDWQAVAGTFVGETDAPCVTWQAPALDGAYTVFCQVTELTTDQSAWAFIEMTVETSLEGASGAAAGCSVDPTRPPVPAALLTLPLLLLALRRR